MFMKIILLTTMLASLFSVAKADIVITWNGLAGYPTSPLTTVSDNAIWELVWSADANISDNDVVLSTGSSVSGQLMNYTGVGSSGGAVTSTYRESDYGGISDFVGGSIYVRIFDANDGFNARDVGSNFWCGESQSNPGQGLDGVNGITAANVTDPANGIPGTAAFAYGGNIDNPADFAVPGTNGKVVPVPEPSTFALLAPAMLFLFGMRRRK